MIINSADGKSNADVSNGQVHAYASNDSRIADVSKREKLSFTWTIATYDYDAADTILTVCNDNSEKNLHIEKIIVGGDTNTIAQIHKPAYATWAGTAVTGVCLSGSGAPEATAKADETGQATQGSLVGTTYVLANTSVQLDYGGALVLGYHEAVGVDLVTAGTACQCSIWGYYE